MFVCSSRAEGFSTVVSEASIIGIPVVSVDVSGAHEPVGNPRCSVIVENNEEALFKGLKDILSTPNKLLELKEETAKNRNEIFNANSMIKEIEIFLTAYSPMAIY